MRSKLSSMLCALLLADIAFGGQAPEPMPEPAAFLAEVRKRLRGDRLLLSQYTFIEKNTERQLDGKGNIKKLEVEVYEVYPSLEENQTYQRLISRDGKPVSSEELAKQDREHDKNVRERALKLEREKTSEREKRLSRAAEERRKEDEAIDEMFRLYEMALVERRMLDGYSTIVVSFKPRPDFKPVTQPGKLLMKLAGRAWIHETEFELIRVEGELIQNLSMGMGLLAKLNKGATAFFQRRKVNDEIWLPAEARFAGTGRLFLFKGLRIDVLTEYSDYKKYSVETSVSYR